MILKVTNWFSGSSLAEWVEWSRLSCEFVRRVVSQLLPAHIFLYYFTENCSLVQILLYSVHNIHYQSNDGNAQSHLDVFLALKATFLYR